MSLSDLAAIGSFVSGFAVLASLIFIGVQMRQNTQAVRAASSQAHAINFQHILTPLIETADVARIWRLGLGSIDSLTDDERVRFVVLVSGIFRFFEAARLQWRHGQLDSEHWQNIETNVRDFSTQPGVRVYWAMRRHWNSGEFRTWYESLPQPTAARDLYGKPAEIGKPVPTD